MVRHLLCPELFVEQYEFFINDEVVSSSLRVEGCIHSPCSCIGDSCCDCCGQSANIPANVLDSSRNAVAGSLLYAVDFGGLGGVPYDGFMLLGYIVFELIHRGVMN
jgi:hypothetical protein